MASGGFQLDGNWSTARSTNQHPTGLLEPTLDWIRGSLSSSPYRSTKWNRFLFATASSHHSTTFLERKNLFRLVLWISRGILLNTIFYDPPITKLIVSTTSPATSTTTTTSTTTKITHANSLTREVCCFIPSRCLRLHASVMHQFTTINSSPHQCIIHEHESSHSRAVITEEEKVVTRSWREPDCANLFNSKEIKTQNQALLSSSIITPTWMGNNYLFIPRVTSILLLLLLLLLSLLLLLLLLLLLFYFVITFTSTWSTHPNDRFRHRYSIVFGSNTSYLSIFQLLREWWTLTSRVTPPGFRTVSLATVALEDADQRLVGDCWWG